MFISTPLGSRASVLGPNTTVAATATSTVVGAQFSSRQPQQQQS